MKCVYGIMDKKNISYGMCISFFNLTLGKDGRFIMITIFGNYTIMYLMLLLVLFGEKDGLFVNFPVTKVLCEAWLYLQMDVFSCHVELIARNYQVLQFFILSNSYV